MKQECSPQCNRSHMGAACLVHACFTPIACDHLAHVPHAIERLLHIAKMLAHRCDETI